MVYATRALAPGPSTVFPLAQATSVYVIGSLVLDEVALFVLFTSTAWFTWRFWRHDRDVEDDALTSSERSWRLASNLLPAPVINALLLEASDSDNNSALAFAFPAVALLQSDIIGFTALGAKLAPEALCELLHALFSEFDAMADWLLVHKLETLGDAVRARLPTPSPPAPALFILSGAPRN